MRREVFLFCNRWGSERVDVCFNQVAISLILSGFFQRAAAKNKEKEQETCENYHRINIFLVKKLRSDQVRILQKRSQLWFRTLNAPSFNVVNRHLAKKENPPLCRPCSQRRPNNMVRLAYTRKRVGQEVIKKIENYWA